MIKSIKDIKGEITDNIVKIPAREMTNRINNKKVTGKKINHLFFVKIENITEKDDYYYFDLNSVKQLKPTICVHLQITSDRKGLMEFYSGILD